MAVLAKPIIEKQFMANVISCGSDVRIGDDIPAKVSAISIRDKRVLYEVTWWDGRTRKVEWLEEFEVKQTCDTPRSAIGFR